MKKATIMIAVIAALVITGCNNDKKSGAGKADPQSSPGAVAETIFDAAKSGNYQTLPQLIDSEADGDSKRIGSVASDPAMQEEFKKYFAKGKMNGEPLVEGDKASVKILFGPDGDKEETFEMVKKNGNWYLKSF
jgi:predicted small secreted protein